MEEDHPFMGQLHEGGVKAIAGTVATVLSQEVAGMGVAITAPHTTTETLS